MPLVQIDPTQGPSSQSGGSGYTGPAPPDWTNPDAPAYPTGPTTKKSPWHYKSGKRGSSKDIFAGIPGPEVDAATQLIQTFAGLVGWPVNVDWNQAAADMLHAGINPASQQDVYEWLYASKYVTDAQRQGNPWAEFGLSPDLYRTVTEKLSNTYFDIVGDAMPGDTLKRAIKENWSPNEMQNFLEFGDPSGAVAGKAAPALIDSPWVTQGDTYKQSLEQYSTMVGEKPADKSTLAAWYRFRSMARQQTDQGLAYQIGFQRPSQQSQSQDTLVR